MQPNEIAFLVALPGIFIATVGEHPPLWRRLFGVGWVLVALATLMLYTQGG